MTDEDKSIDITGIGKIAKSIPESSWNKLVDTACNTFTKLISPITSSTFGLGKLIEAKFDGMVDAQKILAADTVARAKNKIEQSKAKIKDNPKAIIIVNAIEHSSIETDENIRELWANLIANEVISNDVHPECIKILERLNTNDAVVLTEIATTTEKEDIKIALKNALFRLDIMSLSISSFVKDEIDFSREHMQNLNLIYYSSGEWRLTLVGEEFLKSVADPAFVENKA